mmetsp:Transcript_52432/g.132530  ORF Transcript_52432/g.132530 Transcript_52432/m.132530 type:complete len:201 (+) Transcript_52432:817-1419(+)
MCPVGLCSWMAGRTPTPQRRMPPPRSTPLANAASRHSWSSSSPTAPTSTSLPRGAARRCTRPQRGAAPSRSRPCSPTAPTPRRARTRTGPRSPSRPREATPPSSSSSSTGTRTWTRLTASSRRPCTRPPLGGRPRSSTSSRASVHGSKKQTPLAGQPWSWQSRTGRMRPSGCFSNEVRPCRRTSRHSLGWISSCRRSRAR